MRLTTPILSVSAPPPRDFLPRWVSGVAVTVFCFKVFVSPEMDWLVEREAVKSINGPWILDGVIRGIGWIAAFYRGWH